MAITYAYPTVTPELQDLLVGTEIAAQGGESAPRTRTFTVESIANLAKLTNTPTLQQVTTAGAITNKPVAFNNQVVFGGSEIGTSIYCATSASAGLRIDMDETPGTALLIVRDDAPTATPFKYEYYNGDEGTTTTLAILNTAGDFTAKSFIKTGGGATEYLMADGNARIHTVTNSTQATAFTAATLNSTYPTATIGFTVQCTNGAVLKSYQKTSTGWISYTIANVA